MNGHDFETEIAALFGEKGYRTEQTRGSGDDGIDIWLEKGGKKYIVQCKAHEKPVGPATVQGDPQGSVLTARQYLHWTILPVGQAFLS